MASHSGIPAKPKGRDLIKSWADSGHSHRRICPGCGANLAVVGITALLYTFEPCSCDSFSYEHLVEQLWHRTCFEDVAAHDALRVVLDRKANGEERRG